MGRQGFQIGWIPYLNLRPMHQELLRATGGTLSLMTGHPTTVNRWLCDGTVALAPCSSINLLRNSELDIALPLGIASDGPVMSVYIGLRREHSEVVEFIQTRQAALRQEMDDLKRRCGSDVRKISLALLESASRITTWNKPLPKIIFTPASAASAALAKILLKLWFGTEAADHILVRSDDVELRRQMQVKDGDAPMELVIGDEALARRPEFSKILDLGQKWSEITQLPFVFAVWQTSLKDKDFPSGVKTLLKNAASLSSARMRVEPQTYAPDPLPLDEQGCSIDLAAYWNVIQYSLTARHFQGLLLYLSLYSSFFGTAVEANIPARLAKWNGQWSEGFGAV